MEISPSYFGVKPEDLNVHAAAARADNRPMPTRPVGHVRGHTGMQGNKDKVMAMVIAMVTRVCFYLLACCINSIFFEVLKTKVDDVE